MKKTFISAIFVSVLLLSFSCAKESTVQKEEPAEMVPLTVVAGDTKSKTHLNGNDVLWDASGEKLKVYEDYRSGIQSFTTNDGVTTDGGATMSFTASRTQRSSSSFTYHAVYPSSAADLDGNTGLYYATTPCVQYPTATSFDPKADLLIAQELQTTTQATELNMCFARVVAVGKMTIKNLVTKDNIVSVRFKPMKNNQYIPLSGDTSFDLSTARNLYGYGDKERYTYVEMQYPDQSITANNMSVWFTCYPFELQAGDAFRIEVKTAGATFVRNVTIPAGRTLEFKMGKPTVFSVDMSGATMTEDTINERYGCLTAGEWISAGGSTTTKDVTVYQANGAIWHTNAKSSGGNIALQTTSTSSYIGMPNLNYGISKVRIHVASAPSSTSRVFFGFTATSTSNGINVDITKEGIYELTNNQNRASAYIRCSGSPVNISKIEVFTKNDPRPALATPQDVQAHLQHNAQNKLSVYWSAVSDAVGYYVTIKPASGTPITQYVSGKLSADFKDLPYETSFTPSVIAVPADPYTTAESNRGTGSAISTLADPNAPSNWKRVSLSQTNENDIVVIVCSNNQGDYALPNNTTEGAMTVIETVPVVIRDDELKGTVPDNLKWRIADEMGDYVFYQYGSNVNRLYCVIRYNGIGVGTDINQCYEFYETEENGFKHLYNPGQRKYIGTHGSLFWTTFDQYDSELEDQDIMIFKYRP